MSGPSWYLIVGVLLVGVAASSTVVRRLPLTTSLLYLGVGVVLGPLVFGRIRVDMVEHAGFVERLTEVAVIVSLFAAGLKLRTPLSNRRWLTPVRLATVSMTITVVLIALAGTTLLGLPLGAAVLLGAVLAPTDPVLASDVQVAHPMDSDRLRFALTGEAGMNDGAAFPFVMLGLGLLGHHELGSGGWRWFTVDVLWAIVAGLAIGGGMGWGVGRAIVWLRHVHKEALGLDDLLALGLIALSYGVAVLCRSYGFLAVFAAGLALRAAERRATQATAAADVPPDVVLAAAAQEADTLASDPETATAYMAQAALGFTEQLERLLEIGVVVIVGAMLSQRTVAVSEWWFVPLLFLVIRPVAVLLGAGAAMPHALPVQRRLVMWFGIRGIGSIYYLAFALQHGFAGPGADRVVALVLLVVASSIVLHGISVTPLMKRYERLLAQSRRG